MLCCVVLYVFSVLWSIVQNWIVGLWFTCIVQCMILDWIGFDCWFGLCCLVVQPILLHDVVLSCVPLYCVVLCCVVLFCCVLCGRVLCCVLFVLW